MEAKKGKFSLTAKNTKFTVSDDGVNDAHIVNAILDIDNTIHGEVGNLDYSKENNVISATDLSVDFSTAKGTAVKVNVGSLKYEEKAFSLQGISGDLSINLGSTSMTYWEEKYLQPKERQEKEKPGPPLYQLLWKQEWRLRGENSA